MFLEGEETYQETSTDEHSECDRCRLEGNSNKHDEDTNDNSNPTTPPIRKPWRNWNGTHRTNRHDGVEKTSHRWGGLEICCGNSVSIHPRTKNNIGYKHNFQLSTVCRPFIIDPSKPLVADTKMTVPSSIYSLRSPGSLCHTTNGNERPPRTLDVGIAIAPPAPIIAVFVADWGFLKSWKVDPAQKESPIVLTTENNCGRIYSRGDWPSLSTLTVQVS